MTVATSCDIGFPFPEPPEPGELREVAEGVLWLRLALPFALDHVNIFLIEDGPGWTALDAGIADGRTRAAWEQVLTQRLAGKPVNRLVITHYHPDHAGLAGWLLGRAGAELAMSAAEHAMSRYLRAGARGVDSAAHRAFYQRHGLETRAIEALMGRGHAYLRMTTDLPPRFHLLRAGDVLRIGGRDFEVWTGAGHAPEQVMLVCRAAGLFFAADQVLARISPNISVHAYEPEGDPLAAYLASLAALKAGVPGGVLVLPGHNLPFYGLHPRIDQLMAHHQDRCGLIASACRTAPRSAADLLPVVFKRSLDAHQTGFAFGEIVAHLRYMRQRGELSSVSGADGVERARLVVGG